MLINYFKTAWRNLVKNKLFALLNISGLAIGVLVCLLIGVWLQSELSYDNFHPHGNRIFRLVNTFKSESESFSQAPSGIAFGAQLPKQLPAVRAACRVFCQFNYKFKAGINEFFEPNTLVIDSNFFSFFGFKLGQGNPKQVLKSPNQIVLSEKMAVKYFGSAKDALGKTLLMDENPMTVSGVAENPVVNSQIQFDILVPYAFFRPWALAHWKEDIDNQWVGGWPFVYVELTDPQDWKEVETQINAVAEKFSAKEWKENKMSYQYFLQPIRDVHLKSHLRYDAPNNGSLSIVNIFSIVGIFVLLLACINYINLSSAGAIKRAKETSVRKVIGAVKMQLAMQFFLETIMICTISACFGVLLLKALLPSFSAWKGQPYFFPLTITNILIIVAFTISISAMAGIYPVVMLSSISPAITLKGNFYQSKRGNIIRKSLVVFQFTITVALISSILIISQQMNFIKNKSLGFNSNAVMEVNFNGDQNVIKHFGSIKNELLKDSYILNVTKHDQNIVGGLGNGWTTTEDLNGKEVSTSIYRLSVDADYFDTYHMKLAAGRFFSKNVPSDSSKSVLVNEAAIKIFGWKTPENAIGKPFGKGEERRFVIGVVKDFNFESLHKPVDALLIGYARSGNIMSLKIDAAHINDAVRQLKQTWRDIVPEVPLQYSFVDQRIAQQYGSEQKMEGIFYVFSGLALLIACLGLFGLTTFVVDRKVKEIGIRKVLGASISGIVGLLSMDFLKLVLISILIASPLAWYFMNRWLQDFAYRINIGIWVFILAGLTAVLIALFTVSIQAIKAAMANPVKSLRAE